MVGSGTVRMEGSPMTPRFLLLAMSFSISLLVTPAFAQSQNWLVGTWKLLSSTQTESGQTRDYIGPQPLGQIMFGADGRFINILLRSHLKKFDSNSRAKGTAEENAEVVKGSIAYFGTYTLNGDRLTMHLEGSTFPNWTGTDQVRVVHLSGNQLIWENTAASAGGGALKEVYEKVK